MTTRPILIALAAICALALSGPRADAQQVVDFPEFEYARIPYGIFAHRWLTLNKDIPVEPPPTAPFTEERFTYKPLMSVYRPTGNSAPTGQTKAMIFINSGIFVSRNLPTSSPTKPSDEELDLVAPVLARGYYAFVISHTPVNFLTNPTGPGEVTWSPGTPSYTAMDIARQVRAAVVFIKEHWGAAIDVDRIGILGNSSGGTIANQLLFNGHIPLTNTTIYRDPDDDGMGMNGPIPALAQQTFDDITDNLGLSADQQKVFPGYPNYVPSGSQDLYSQDPGGNMVDASVFVGALGVAGSNPRSYARDGDDIAMWMYPGLFTYPDYSGVKYEYPIGTALRPYAPTTAEANRLSTFWQELFNPNHRPAPPSPNLKFYDFWFRRSGAMDGHEFFDSTVVPPLAPSIWDDFFDKMGPAFPNLAPHNYAAATQPPFPQDWVSFETVVPTGGTPVAAPSPPAWNGLPALYAVAPWGITKDPGDPGWLPSPDIGTKYPQLTIPSNYFEDFQFVDRVRAELANNTDPHAATVPVLYGQGTADRQSHRYQVDQLVDALTAGPPGLFNNRVETWYFEDQGHGFRSVDRVYQQRYLNFCFSYMESAANFSNPSTIAADLDDDGDGINAQYDPIDDDRDIDGDGVNDGYEARIGGWDPLAPAAIPGEVDDPREVFRITKISKEPCPTSPTDAWEVTLEFKHPGMQLSPADLIDTISVQTTEDLAPFEPVWRALGSPATIDYDQMGGPSIGTAVFRVGYTNGHRNSRFFRLRWADSNSKGIASTLPVGLAPIPMLRTKSSVPQQTTYVCPPLHASDLFRMRTSGPMGNPNVIRLDYALTIDELPGFTDVNGNGSTFTPDSPHLIMVMYEGARRRSQLQSAGLPEEYQGFEGHWWQIEEITVTGQDQAGHSDVLLKERFGAYRGSVPDQLQTNSVVAVRPFHRLADLVPPYHYQDKSGQTLFPLPGDKVSVLKNREFIARSEVGPGFTLHLFEAETCGAAPSPFPDKVSFEDLSALPSATGVPLLQTFEFNEPGPGMGTWDPSVGVGAPAPQAVEDVWLSPDDVVLVEVLRSDTQITEFEIELCGHVPQSDVYSYLTVLHDGSVNDGPEDDAAVTDWPAFVAATCPASGTTTPPFNFYAASIRGWPFPASAPMWTQNGPRAYLLKPEVREQQVENQQAIWFDRLEIISSTNILAGDFVAHTSTFVSGYAGDNYTTNRLIEGVRLQDGKNNYQSLEEPITWRKPATNPSEKTPSAIPFPASSDPIENIFEIGRGYTLALGGRHFATSSSGQFVFEWRRRRPYRRVF